MDTLILLRGGHKTLVKGQKPVDIEHELRDFDPDTGNGLFYIQTANRGDNGLVIDPTAIVALVASP